MYHVYLLIDLSAVSLCIANKRQLNDITADMCILLQSRLLQKLHFHLVQLLLLSYKHCFAKFMNFIIIHVYLLQ